jgi:hypothetical protein
MGISILLALPPYESPDFTPRSRFRQREPPKPCPHAFRARFSKNLTKGRILRLRRFAQTRRWACQQKDAKGPTGQAKSMKTIENNPNMRTVF